MKYKVEINYGLDNDYNEIWKSFKDEEIRIREVGANVVQHRRKHRAFIWVEWLASCGHPIKIREEKK